MSAFTEFDQYEPVGGIDYVLIADLAWEIGWNGSGKALIIPAGTVFQSSVPRGARWIVSPHHKPWLLASAVHDEMLKRGYSPARAAGEWYEAVKAFADQDRKRWLVKPALIGVIVWTV